MVLKRDLILEDQAVKSYLVKLTNQIYKLLPSREEGIDWQWPLKIIIEEIMGMKEIFISHQDKLLSLLCKLEGMKSLNDEKDFMLYRRTIFECLSILKEVAADDN